MTSTSNRTGGLSRRNGATMDFPTHDKGGLMPSVTIRAGAAVLGIAFASGLAAQSESSAPKSGFGTEDLHAVTLNHYAFRPINSAQTYSATCCGGDFYVNPTGGSAIFFA